MNPRDESIGRFGDFELLERLGRDGAFALFRARQVRLDRSVTLKVPVGPVTLEQGASLWREAAAANALDHPYIVRVFEVGDHGGRPYLAMAHIGGQRLNHRLKSVPLKWRLAVDLIRQLSAALTHAHERGTIHGALRPEVIWLTTDGQVRLCGFGSPMRFDEIDAEATVGFTGFLAPEQAGARGTVSRNTDLYGLGALLYAMLTGVPPHQAASVSGTFRLICNSQPVAPSRLTPDLPEDLDEICLKCLRITPGKRYGTERPLFRLTADLRRLQSGRAVRRPADFSGRMRAWSRRHSQALRIAVAIALFGLIPAWWDRWRCQSAWQTLADGNSSFEERLVAARHFERLQADQAGDEEIPAAMLLARFRLGQPLAPDSRSPVWHTSGDEWSAVQQLTRALDAVRRGRTSDARAVLRGAKVTHYEPRTEVERWLFEELEKAVGS